MDAAVYATGGFFINLLLGGVIWLMRKSYDEIKEEQRLQRQELDKVKNTYFLKEDFREFKKDLWDRLDKLEMSWSEKLNELRKQ